MSVKSSSGKNVFTLVSFWVILTISFACATASDWPTFHKDNQRSGITQEQLPLPLYQQWQYVGNHVPEPAWPPPAETDYWHREANLKPRVVFDRAFQVVANNGALYFGSSANDKIICLDASTGRERWSFFTSGPVRLAPTLHDGKVYAGSDDGNVYCLQQTDGSLLWKFKAALNDRIVPGNERLISICPIRTDVLIDGDIAYFCSGIFPNEGVALYAVNARDGSEIWARKNLNISPQGYLLASATKLYVPTGRTTPVIFSRKDGALLGRFRGNGGTFALLDGDKLFYGIGDEGEIETSAPNSNDKIASFNGLQMIISRGISYLREDKELSAIDRQKYYQRYKKLARLSEKRSDLADDLWDLREKRNLVKKSKLAKLDRQIDKLVGKLAGIDRQLQEIESGGILWQQPIGSTYSMILAGDILFVGGDGKIDAYRAADGTHVWSATVDGKAYGLAVANGRLFVSTDTGHIYGFAPDEKASPNIQRVVAEKNPFAKDKLTGIYKNAARHILDKTGLTKGYCLVLGSDAGRLAYELARQSGLRIVVVDDDAWRVQINRRNIDKAGLYGKRVTVLQGSLQKLPFNDYFANLIVSDRSLITGDVPTPADEVYRLLRPFGGIAFIGGVMNGGDGESLQSWIEASSHSGWKTEKYRGSWAILQRGALPGAGEWTHLYADAANTACSLDPLRAPVHIQWFGKPGPRNIINRHSRTTATLFKDGRLFIPGNNRVICVDAYNGFPLWMREVPRSRILGALKDFGNMVVTDDYLYVAARDKCYAFKVATGELAFTIDTPQAIADKPHEWGYISTVGDQLFGSGKKPGASFYELGRFNCDELEGDFRDMISSDYLFSVNRKNGKKLWTYRNGVIFNNTITVGDDAVFLVESRNSKAMATLTGRLRVDVFCADKTYIVKLDKRTGRKIWEKPYRFPFQQIMYLSYADNILLVTGSYNKGRHVHYGLYAFDAETGAEKWRNSFQGGNNRWEVGKSRSTVGGSHGEQWQHPVIVENTVILPPHDFDLHTGKMGSYQLTRGGHGCGGLSGSKYYLFARGSNPRIYKIVDGPESGTPLSRVNRPGCWINTIPAGGLVSIPESSSGCTCDYPIQTSIVFAPASDSE